MTAIDRLKAGGSTKAARAFSFYAADVAVKNFIKSRDQPGHPGDRR